MEYAAVTDKGNGAFTPETIYGARLIGNPLLYSGVARNFERGGGELEARRISRFFAIFDPPKKQFLFKFRPFPKEIC